MANVRILKSFCLKSNEIYGNQTLKNCHYVILILPSSKLCPSLPVIQDGYCNLLEKKCESLRFKDFLCHFQPNCERMIITWYSYKIVFAYMSANYSNCGDQIKFYIWHLHFNFFILKTNKSKQQGGTLQIQFLALSGIPTVYLFPFYIRK